VIDDVHVAKNVGLREQAIAVAVGGHCGGDSADRARLRAKRDILSKH
jgi:hypothetical protein